MTDDAADDDERLKSLRAVWLSMPDEDPPERGLSDLMAAARVKANEMSAKAEPATPSMWQRFLDLMRRPPVLALATVTVLIGGAALVGRRADKMESAPSVAQTPSSAESMPAAPAPDPAATTTAAQGSAMELAPEAPPAPGGGEGGNEGQAANGLVGGADVDRKAPLKHAAGSKQGAKQTVQTKPVDEKEPVRRAPLSDSPADSPADRSIEQRTDAFDDGDLAKDAAPKKTRGPTPPPKEESKVGGASAAATTNASATDSTSITELHRGARRAASQKDCVAMRQLTQKIASLDPAYYKANVAHDPALAVCTNSN